jgi:hypothetical protein
MSVLHGTPHSKNMNAKRGGNTITIEVESVVARPAIIKT